MSGLETVLHARLHAAFSAVVGAPTDPLVQRSVHADFQANGALSAARRLGVAPRDVAARVLARADLADLADARVAGAGFINLTVHTAVLDQRLLAMATDPRLGVSMVDRPERMVVDYGGPNVAKEMHVGHLRSTILGDCLVRVLRFVGHDVRIVSHLGDWGTQFGMLLERLVEIGEAATAYELSVGDLDGYYKAARARFDADPSFVDRSRRRVVALQSGDPGSQRLWRMLVAESERYFSKVNTRLGVLLTTEDYVGESFYNDQLDDVVSELDGLGLLRVSDGALCAFPPGFTGRDGAPFPLMVRKSDGGYGYAATDLAALRHRVRSLGARRLLYVTGAPQRQHLAMVFAVGRQAGWLDGGVTVAHLGFGQVLGADGRKLASRRGASVKLSDLLDEAVTRAAALVTHLDPDARADVAEAVGIGAVKYADLSNHLARDYVFDLDRMLGFTGDTGGYLQYAHARIHSVLSKVDSDTAPVARVVEPAERSLALALLGFPGAVSQVATDLEPHTLARYLRDLAVAFTAFYEACPVLRAHPEVRAARVTLCRLSADVLARGLDLLGLRAPRRM